MHDIRRTSVIIAIALLLPMLALAGCGGSGSQGGSGGSASSGQSQQASGSSQSGGSKGTTTGAPFSPSPIDEVVFNAAAAESSGAASIDTSHVADGYVGAAGTSASRLKLEVAKDGVSMYYDMPSDGSPVFAPLSMGSGQYSLKVWENTSGNRYAQLMETAASASMSDEFQPFLHASLYCNFNGSSQSTQMAAQLTSGAENQGDALAAIYDWVVDNITYDKAKAEKLAGESGYVPNPDSTIASKTGICFDYASLVAAMLRSQGIPCKIITGNVAPDDIYHAWNMVYIDGTWVTTNIDVKQGTWTRMDPTFDASGSSAFVGDGTNYSDRYTY